MAVPAQEFSLEERVAMAARCRDCDAVPKVSDAGMVLEDAEGRRVQIMHNGLRVLADGYYGRWMTDLIRLCQGHHEAQEERLFHEVEKRLSPAARMIELGGFWSYYSLWFLMNHADRRSLVVEPEPAHLAVGRENARINGLSPTFLAGFAGGSFSADEPFRAEVAGDLRLPRYSVPHLMEQEGWSDLDLLHMDVQGAETEVLESCRSLLSARAVKWVFVSTHHHVISGDPLTHQRCLQILRECGAIIEAEHDVHESFSGDGLIVARFVPAPSDWVSVHLSTNRASQSLFRHLAYDLDASLHEAARLTAELEALKPSSDSDRPVRKAGELVVLQRDGPLGTAGDHVLLPDDQVIAPAVRHDGAWDEANLEAFSAHVPAGEPYTLIDVGANLGLFTRQMLNRLPQINNVVCFEPDPRNFAALRYNLSAFADRVRLCHAALGDVDGQMRFFRDAENIGNYSLNGDAMRNRPFDTISVSVRDTATYLDKQLGGYNGRLLWKSDTQGWDELIVARTPLHIWERVDVALMEVWRIEKPPLNHNDLRARIEIFPNRRLGNRDNVSADEILAFLSESDWHFEDLLLWR